MSEGPQVLRRTEWLDRHLSGRQVVRCQSTRSDIPPDALTGQMVQRAFCKGKHIFIEFDDGSFLHNHLLMRGVWRKLEGQQLFLPDGTWLALYVGPYTICNLKGQLLKLVEQEEVTALCDSLGPDAMTQPFPSDEIRRSLAGSKLPVAEALLTQSIVAGVGNIAKSEALYRARVDPRIAACELVPVQMERLLDAIHSVLWDSYYHGGRWTHHIYRRVSQRCDQCGTTIRSMRLSPSKRATYFCPECQAPEF